MNRNASAVIWPEGRWFVAQCLDVDVASQGNTESETLENLKEALELQFTAPTATILPNVRTVEFEVAA